MALDSSVSGLLSSCPSMLISRDYQIEMFELSLKGNVIVVMDTGSGKTQVALLRIMLETERQPHKIAWFLAPKVALCIQQHDTIKLRLPHLRTRLLLGSDNVDRWGEQAIWDSMLDNIAVVVSTYAILSDALCHGFVKMDRLSLIVFDEAHCCMGAHPANQIMKNFYHPQKARWGSGSSFAPGILGLTASPISRDRISELDVIETNLDAISIAPRLHRQELQKNVHRPETHRLDYEALDCDDIRSSNSHALKSLYSILQSLDTCSESLNTHEGLESHLGKFYRKAQHIYSELGPWAADFFILETIKALETNCTSQIYMLQGGNGIIGTLLRLLKQDPLLGMLANHSHLDTSTCVVSPKVERLISFLEDQDHNKCSGLLFVKQRVTVSVLYSLLSNHARTKGRFQCATFVGLSNSSARRYALSELLDLKAQSETLNAFRARRKNIVIATDALEEGIDVASCNLVICFDPPPNVKSFMQRRGRARQEKSQFAIMFSENEDPQKIQDWTDLEARLVDAYLSQEREIQSLADIENTQEVVPGKLEVKTTGALLTPDRALEHIHHFCSRLPDEKHVDLKPKFKLDEDPNTKLTTATVILPNCLEPSLRSTTGIDKWRSERAAVKDAAFQAYTALYKAGLLNNHLLPLSHSWETEAKEGPFGAVVDVSMQYRPWDHLAKAWSAPDLHRTLLTMRRQGSEGESMNMVLTSPSVIPIIPPLDLYWNESTSFRIEFDSCSRVSVDDQHTIQVKREITHLLSQSTHSHYTSEIRDDFIMLFNPNEEEYPLVNWLESNSGRVPAQVLYQDSLDPSGFVRTPSYHNAPNTFHGWYCSSTTENGDQVYIDCVPLPKRRYFLERKPVKNVDDSLAQTGPSKLERFPIEECTVDRLSFEYAQFSLFIPAILQSIEVCMVAEGLRTTILSEVTIKDLSHVVTAIAAPSAGLTVHYQQYEFLGDAVLKFIVSQQLFSENGNWHEGYLSSRRDSIVSNGSLAKAALDSGLDKYIIKEAFKARKWSPMVISEAQTDPRSSRSISAKVLADVVEALIGAAYLDGGLNVARECIHAFLSNIKVSAPKFSTNDSHLPPSQLLRDVELLTGRQFRNKTLMVEALTHPSCNYDIQRASYQRLEFLGDAVLDMLVVSAMASQRSERTLSQSEMTLIKAALVNANFLGFLCLGHSIDDTTIEILEQPKGKFAQSVRSTSVHLWKQLRHSSATLPHAQRAALERYAAQHAEIASALRDGTTYPWRQLARLRPDKFLSDMIESILGAIFVDSGGELEACRGFVKHIGLESYLDRVLAGEVDMTHPRVALEKIVGGVAVEYDVRQEDVGDEDEENSFVCSVKVGGIFVTEVTDCWSKEEAIVVGAWKATEEIQMKPELQAELLLAAKSVSDIMSGAEESTISENV